MNDKTELIQRVLTELGFRPEVDEEGDVIFRYEMKTMYVICRYEDEFINVVYPQYYELEDGEEYFGLFLCMKQTREIKHIKTFLDNDMKNVSSSAEFWYVEEADLKNSLEKAIMMLGCARSKFMEDLKEITRMKNESSDEDSNDDDEDKGFIISDIDVVDGKSDDE